MTMGFMWCTLILYCVCQNRLHFVHVCMHISCMLFFDVFVFVCMCVCMCLCLFRFVCLFACFFLRLLVCLFGSVWLLVWFRLFIGLVCLFVWIVCWLLGFVVVSAVRAIAGGVFFSAFTWVGTFEDTWAMALEALDTCNSMWNRKSLIFPCRPDGLWVFSSLPQRSLTQWMFWLEELVRSS